ncbi:MAG TPA: tetrahydrofolate dehydrogenase/cyclohydrolase catalytic domain-containing protein, partial [bacterium]|nr:tetrahydrofolate dehydrogenase/cyclohydrolase catalytic domain-containing protein [bacterium]
MDAILLNGIEAGKRIESELKNKTEELLKKNIKPSLAVILAGDDKPSQTYVNLKKKKCETLGVDSQIFKFDKNADDRKILDLIDNLNRDPKIHGILVQLPLPEKLNTANIINAINPEKDVDGFHPLNIGRLA